MSDTLHDPFDAPAPPAAEPFAIGYRRSNGEGLVYGGLMFAAGLLVLGLFGKARILTSLSLIPIFVAYWHYPMVDRGQPQLGANKDGLFLERLGFLRWDAIAGFHLRQTSVRMIEIAVLDITLTGTLEDAIAKAQVFPFWRAVMTRCWKVKKNQDGQTVLRVNLHPLNGEAEEIVSRLRAFRPV
ncbi:hypothetical protein [Roseibium aestuarii]|uniref:PH domain-containing protein n=1 Tax=Roseibium aestuarii TaxID=2600299 RepID=A0ABW4JVB9_9HYPH|nr:hypothetical protein [Roseibium aestuarii]